MESANNNRIVVSWAVSVSGLRDCLVTSSNGHMLVKHELLNAY